MSLTEHPLDKSFMGAVFSRSETQSLAELGFIVVTIDGRGTPGRSKAFHDVSYGDLGQAGNLEDHMTGLRQLAGRYPYMDLDRVGIYGHSGGGFASTRAILAYPDFYKVAVSSAGNHDQRGYLLSWGSTYQGVLEGDNYENTVNARLAGNLKGKLLLTHGGMDDNVHPALTMQVVDALIKANKDFELLLFPNANHSYEGVQAYATRQRWDYFVKHLLGKKPPENYAVSPPDKN
jgi:dipeptidyl-peptidase-4